MTVLTTRPGVNPRDYGADPAVQDRRPVRVLVVDDCRDNADSLAMMLRCSGEGVVVAYDAVSALRLAEDFRPDLALVDIGLPVMNGIDLAERLLQQSDGQLILAAVSGHTSGKYLQQWQERIGGEYLFKPVAPKTILTLVESVAQHV